MPRSSFSENPLLRVSRPVSACSRCRSAKVKCDGKLPACTACEKAGRESECSAANDQFARGKERSYVAALELRIEKLERRLAYARSRKASVALHEPDAAPDAEIDRKDSLTIIKAAIHRNAARKRENSDMNSLVSDFGYLSVNATTRDFEPTATNMTFARLVLAASTNDPLPDLEGSESLELPSKHAAYNIVHYYMTNIYAFFPAFSETIILSLLNDLYQEDPAPLRSTDAWLLWMVLAVGSTAQSQSKDDEFYRNGVQFVARALNYADRALMPGYVTQIQSLLLLTQYSMFDPAHFDSWTLIGFTSRAVIDLGFHQDAALRSSSDKAIQESRRKLFYCVYSLDRAISMVHALAFSFTDDSTSVSLPSMATPASKASTSGIITGPVSLDAALPLFQLRRKQSQCYQTLVQSDPTIPLPDPTSFIWQICHDMQRWSGTLQNNLPLPIREMFELELRYSYVYCISPSPRAPEMTPYGRLLIFEHAILYLERIYKVAHASTNVAFYTYHDALRVYFMGSQFVAVLRDAGDMLLSANGAAIQSIMLASKPGPLHPPPLPERFDHATAGDYLERSLRCLDHVSLTLKKWGARWENALRLLENFEMISTDIKDMLKTKKEMRDTATAQGQGQGQCPPQPMQQHQQHPHFHTPPPNPNPHVSPSRVAQSPQHLPPQHTPPVQHHPLQQQQNVRWVDVDVAQIIREGGQI